MRLPSATRAQLVGAGAATLWLVAVLTVEAATRNPDFVPSMLYALAPLIACSVLPASLTAVYGLVAVALTAISSLWNQSWASQQMWVRVVDVALVSGAAIALAALRMRREKQVARITNIAEVAQRAVLPRVPPQVGPVIAAVRYMSASEDALVGGDLYDWFHSEQRICFIVGDVRGKGVGAVEQAARVIRAFRQFVAIEPELPTAAAKMSAYLAPFMDDEEFATAALIQVERQHVTLVSCGHPPPLLIRTTGDADLLDPPACLPLGIGETYEAARASWSPGDRVFLYTDGLSEARNRRDEYLSVPHLATLLQATDLEASLDGVVATVLGHVPHGRFTDDLAVLLLENAYDVEPRPTDLRDFGIPRPPIASSVAVPKRAQSAPR
jgi:serine phosphatase RsbU (regulator of sigma subunit)